MKSLIISVFLVFSVVLPVVAESDYSIGLTQSYQMHYYDFNAYDEIREYLDLGFELKANWGDNEALFLRLSLYYPYWFIRSNSLGYNRSDELKEMLQFFTGDIMMGASWYWSHKSYNLGFQTGPSLKFRWIKQSFQSYYDISIGLFLSYDFQYYLGKKKFFFIYNHGGAALYPWRFSDELDSEQWQLSSQIFLSLGIGWHI